jgi:hypothetical protein
MEIEFLERGSVLDYRLLNILRCWKLVQKAEIADPQCELCCNSRKALVVSVPKLRKLALRLCNVLRITEVKKLENKKQNVGIIDLYILSLSEAGAPPQVKRKLLGA